VTPAPMTAHKVGSHVPVNKPRTFKNPNTLALCAIPLTRSPAANKAPATMAGTIFLVGEAESCDDDGAIPCIILRTGSIKLLPTTAATTLPARFRLELAMEVVVLAVANSRGKSPGLLWMVAKEVVVTMADAIKVMTATKLRMLLRAKPQMPWPDVQPLPNLVPMPTKSPATLNPNLDNEYNGASLTATAATVGGDVMTKVVAIILARNNPFQYDARSRTICWGRRKTLEETMPLQPKTSPLPNSKVLAANPINAPPMAPLESALSVVVDMEEDG
jgi:hypothetical protein